jgi:hypothetical protein
VFRALRRRRVVRPGRPTGQHRVQQHAPRVHVRGRHGDPRLSRSGGRYRRVPITRPSGPSGSPAIAAIPKSTILVPAGERITLPGLTSRCTRPTSWAAASPAAISVATHIADRGFQRTGVQPLRQRRTGHQLHDHVRDGRTVGDTDSP